MTRALLAACAATLAVLCGGVRAADLDVTITWLRHAQPERPVLSNIDPVPADRGRAGAALGIAENATTGTFLGHRYALEIVEVAHGDDPLPAAQAALAASPYLILDAPADTQLAIADLAAAEDALLFNASAPDNRLRAGDCRRNLLHTIPSFAMKADALMQFAQLRRWTKLALVTGNAPEDAAWADALSASASKFGIPLRGTKSWPFDADMRRNASAEVPLFTQDLPEHDLLLVADVANDFARYIAYNTWLPRPVAGSEGLEPVGWSPVVEQWGAAQLHSRFEEATGRGMQDSDYAAWAAVRAIGEAVTRTGSADAATIRGYLFSDAFELGGFKGRPLSFRGWNGQLRQPIPLVTRSAAVAVAPFDGFLHRVNELDTLGLDAPESPCTAFE